MCLSVALGHKGVDVSELTKNMDCLKKEGMELVIPRCYRSYGSPDPNCKANLANAKKAGMQTDLYIFPCFKCGNPQKQIEDTIKAAGGESFRYMWLDVEVYQWSSDKAANRKFISELAAAVDKAGKKAGIYSNKNNWDQIVGNDWTAMSHYPIWYAHYDKDPSFKDFQPFGGWKTPFMKQYLGDTKLCQEGVDLNYYP